MELCNNNNNYYYYYNDESLWNGPRVMNGTCEMHSSTDEPGYFPILLQDVLWELGNTVKTLYVTSPYSESSHDDYYRTRVHIRECLETSKGMKTR